MNFQDQLRYNLAPGPHFESDGDPVPLPTTPPVKLIAYYLPQFHPVPENDAWWGKGFTEWTNVTKSVPQFEGHYQPHLPGHLGFYDLRIVEVMKQQWALANRHGIGGFCFHYYWFSGRKILDLPLKNLLANPQLDIPFCINWANENWTRTWDGSEREILLAQSHSKEGDVALVEEMISIARDHRYIKIGERPLIMVYRPTLIPDTASTLAQWRELFRARDMPDPYFVMPQAYGIDDPRTIGLDAAAGFPPHKFGPELHSHRLKVRAYNGLFSGEVLSYEALVERAAEFNPAGYKLFHGVFPAWDNTARRPFRGLIFAGSTPSLYGAWLQSACAKAIQNNEPEERLVFINAWNEWAEGAHLEPDRHYGFAYLRETARALSRADRSTEAFGASQTALGSRPSFFGPNHSERFRSHFHRARHKLANGAERLVQFLRPA